MNESTKMEGLLIECQNEFYQTHKKKTFNKTEQKFQCASTSASSFDFERLMANTFLCFPDEERNIHVYFHYPLFKLYAHPDLYMDIVNYMISFMAKAIGSSDTSFIEFHVSLKGFTPTAAHRYKPFLELFSNECLRRQTGYLNHLRFLKMYHVPDISIPISRILLPLAPPEIRPKLQMFTKDQSEDMLQILLKDVTLS